MGYDIPRYDAEIAAGLHRATVTIHLRDEEAGLRAFLAASSAVPAGYGQVPLWAQTATLLLDRGWPNPGKEATHGWDCLRAAKNAAELAGAPSGQALAFWASDKADRRSVSYTTGSGTEIQLIVGAAYDEDVYDGLVFGLTATGDPSSVLRRLSAVDAGSFLPAPTKRLISPPALPGDEV